ncbi:MAG: class I SAM-dependent methyltransferase [Pseudomonadota bacterium]
MAVHILEEPATEDSFNEEAYLFANPDVAAVVKQGGLDSGYTHFIAHGQYEGRKIRFPSSSITEAKATKLQKIKPMLRSDIQSIETASCHDFLSDELREQFNIIDTDAISGHGYDAYALELVAQCENGWVLDCGAGRRPAYFDNVVNFEIADYETTDVRGVGEVLPFVDNSFDAVLSLAVLEHVKDPFLCAREISRVLKPGGKLMCCAAFLSPLHGYPHHYYNMTSQGLENLFQDYLQIDKTTVYESISPIWALTWMLQSWANGLEGAAKDEFMQLTVADLMNNAESYLNRAFVHELSQEKELELACATVLFAHKK